MARVQPLQSRRGGLGTHLVSAAQEGVVFVVVQRVVEGVVTRLLQLHLELLQTEEQMLDALASATQLTTTLSLGLSLPAQAVPGPARRFS